MRFVVHVGFTVIVISLEGFIRYVVGVPFDTIGITLSAVALGQIFPFIVFDTLVVGKILSFETTHSFTNSTFTAKYQVLLNRNEEEIRTLKMKTYLLFGVNLLLFLVTSYLGVANEYWKHVGVALLSYSISTYYLLWA